MKKKIYGHKFKADIPVDGGKPKVCTKCDKWFSAKPRERVCPGCKRYDVKTLLRTHKGRHEWESSQVRSRPKWVVRAHNRQVAEGVQASELWDTSDETPGMAGIRSSYLGLTFKPGVPSWKILALEEAARVDGKRR